MNDYGSVSKPPKPHDSDERMWAMFCQLSTLAGYVMPFGNIVGPLVVWMIKKDEYPLVDDQGKEALNFQISITIWMIISLLLCFVLVGIPILIGLGIFDLIVTIIAAVQANSGNYYRYPLTIRFIA